MCPTRRNDAHRVYAITALSRGIFFASRQAHKLPLSALAARRIMPTSMKRDVHLGMKLTTSAGTLRRVIRTTESGRTLLSALRPRAAPRAVRGAQNANGRAGRVFRAA